MGDKSTAQYVDLQERGDIACAALSENHHFQTIIELMEYQLNLYDIANRCLDGVALSRSQGAANKLADIISFLNGQEK